MGDQAARLAALSNDKRAVLARRAAALPRASSGPVALPRHDGVHTFPTSHAQERLWFLHQVAPASPAYNLTGAFRVDGRLDVTALRATFDALVVRHESLRTTFVAIDGVPLQVVSPRAYVGTTITMLGPDTSTAQIGALLTKEAHRPFDVAHGPLLRLHVVVLGPTTHVVALTTHHLIADAWSVTVLVRELAAFYRGIVRGASPDAPRAGLQYPDYAVWQRARYRGALGDALEAHWRDQLAGAPYPDVAVGDRLHGRGAVERAPIPPPLGSALRELARRQGVTLFVLTLAAWKATLVRWAGSRDVTVLVPVANRDRSEVAETIGFFVNVLALRTRFHGECTFRTAIARVNEVVRGALGHQELPFERVLQALGVDRTLARPPLSPFAFALEPSVPATIDLGDVEAVAWPLEPTTSRTDLALIVSEAAEGLAVRLEYDCDLYAASAVAGLVGEYVGWLERAINDLDARLEPAAAARPRVAEAPGLVAGDGLGTVWSRFAAQARTSSSSVAIRAEGAVVTYEELAADAAYVVERLVAEEVEPGAVVAVFGDRRPAWLCAMLGIWARGAVYLPLDPRWPAPRIVEVLTRSGAVALIADEARCATLPALAHVARRVIAIGGGAAGGAWTADAGAADPHDVAYVIYTSGSTGVPKGALIEHAGMLNHLEAKIGLLGLGPRDRVAQTAATSFDISIWQGVAPLLVGATVEILGDTVMRDPATLRAAVRQRGITILEVVPATLRALLDAGPASELRDAMVSLRWLVVTGEALPPELCRRWIDCCPGVPLVNAYGPTECADDVTHYVVRTPPAAHEARIPIGRPIPGVTVHVLDADLEPVRDGVAGELCIGGVGVGRGYLGEPERTAASFVTPDPFVGREGTRLYRTGDWGRCRPDGALEWLGRLDAQTKIRGTRVEPAEVEAVLCAQPGVREAAVVAVPAVAPSRLVAFVVVGADYAGHEALRRQAAERLPDAMVPATFVEFPALPLTTNGKVDRDALARYGTADDDQPPSGREPATPIECLLATLWEQVLGRSVRSVDAGFFALGGDSLSSIRLVATARRHGLVFSPQQVFEHQTIAALAQIARASTQPLWEQDVLVGDIDLTPIQRMLLDADLPDVAHHNMSILLATARRVRPECLAVVVEHLLRHHDILRLRVRREGLEWRAKIAGLDGAAPFDHHDLSTVDDVQARATIEAIAARLQASLDLEAGPILRVASFDLGPHRSSRLLMIVHHLACDVASWPILLEDLVAVYEQVCAGSAIVLPPKTTSYRTWARRLAERDVAGEAVFWRRECAELGVRLPGEPGAGGPSLADVASLTVSLGEEDTRRLLVATAEAGVTVETALLAALATVLTAPDDGEFLRAFLERHGRTSLWTDVDVSRTVGWFTAVFPVCVRVAGGRRPRDTMALVGEHLRQIPDGGLGWGLLTFGRGSSTAARCDVAHPEVSCNYLGRIDPPLGGDWSLAPESTGREIGQRGTRPTTLDVVGHLAAGQLHVAWHYDRARHRRDDIAAFGDRLLDVVREVSDSDASRRTS